MEEVIRIENLSYQYPDGQKALNGINLSITRGESITLIGPNGAGKSTLLLHLNGILRGDGAVKIMGKLAEEKNLKWIRSKVGFVFQNPDDQLFSPTIFDDVAFGPINSGYSEVEIHQSVKRALEWVGMAGYEKRSPHHLSWGEKKRIAIATVLVMSPEILVADEPSSNLDPRGKWIIIELLKKLPMTKIIASHDLELVRALCQRSIILDKGQVIADGSVYEILSNIRLLSSHGLAPPAEILI
jgi:cobalt/nickel transport system ATP-binding protein